MSSETAAPSRRSRPALHFSARDLVNVAIFAVLLILVSYAIGMLGVISPLFWLISVPLSIIACGIPFVLFLTRVTHPGMVGLFAIIIGVFFLLSGNTPVSTLGIIVLGLLAELVLRAGGYRSRWAMIWAYTVFSLSFFTPFLPLLYDREGYFATASWATMGADYVAATDALFTPPVLGVLAVLALAAGFVGAMLGQAVLRKHFVRAGLA